MRDLCVLAELELYFLSPSAPRRLARLAEAAAEVVQHWKHNADGLHPVGALKAAGGGGATALARQHSIEGKLTQQQQQQQQGSEVPKQPFKQPK